MKSSFICFLIALVSNMYAPVCAKPDTSNIIIIADVHGDINRFRYILRDAGIIDKYDSWIAPSYTTVVQLGDQIDPKDQKKEDDDKKHHFDMIYFTYRLEFLASHYNSTFINLIGNHEYYNIDKIRNNKELSHIIANRPIIKQIGDKLFCHASFKTIHYLIMQQYNITFQDINDLWYNYVKNYTLSPVEQYLVKMLITDADSIIFTKTQDEASAINVLFNRINVTNMFVGHKITEYVHVKNNVWFLDQTLKDAFDKSIYTYITIQNDGIIVKSPRKRWFWIDFFYV